MARRVTQNDADMGEKHEECPVCHSTRYLNPQLKFIISTECYHKMCTGCADRLMARGPVQCPTPGCKATLRRHRFREPTFSDLKLEKEVDIRRMMGKTFNRREEDFETLRAYNDYLAEVEDMTFNLVNGVDVEETERKIEQYRKEHLRAIEENREGEEERAKAFKEAQKAQEEEIRLKRQAALAEQEREKQEQKAIEQEYLQLLEAGGDPEQLAFERATKLQRAAARTQDAMNALESAGSKTSLLQGLKKKKPKVELPPIDPFGGIAHEDGYFTVYEKYPGDRTFTNFEQNKKYTVGGYDQKEWYRWALLDAFAGLGVSIDTEKAEADDVGGNITSAAEAMTVT